MITDFRHTAEKLERRVDEIAGYVYRERVPISGWRVGPGELPGPEAAGFDDSGWAEFRPREHVDVPVWLRTRVRIPASFDGQPAALYLRLEGVEHSLFGTETLVYVDGELVHGTDPYHPEIVLSERAEAGREYSVALHLFWRPDLQYVKSHPQRRLEPPVESMVTELVRIDRAAERFYWDAATAHAAALTMDENDLRRPRTLTALDRAFDLLDLTEPVGDAYYESLATAQAALDDGLPRRDDVSGRPEPTAVAVGQTHIDVAWLWSIPVTHKKIARTFATMLRMIEQYPGYRFFQNQPQVYEYCKLLYPDVYEQVKARVADGSWEANGGMWVEPDCNVPSGESLVRQLVYGQRYFQSEFGVRSDVLCLMDVFGMPGSLPQLMRASGMKYFVTTKMSWNQYNRMPYDSFRWKGIDGSSVLTHLLTAPGRTGTRTACNAILDPEIVKASWDNYQQKFINERVLFTYGYGDGGGGPSKDMLERAGRLAELDVPVGLEMGTVGGFFHDLERRIEGERVPEWNGELYLEFHRGTYTTRGNSKRLNRKSEVLYHDAELFGAVAAALLGRPYPREALMEGWKLILVNQMHDILPGTTTPDVDVYSRIDYERIFELGQAALSGALDAIASNVGSGAPGFVLFNPLSWERDDVARVRLNGAPTEFHVTDGSGSSVPHQVLRRDSEGVDVLLAVRGVPSCGYAAFALRSGPDPERETSMSVSETALENRFFRVELDEQGEVSSLYDKRAGREVLPAGSKANLLQMFEDKPLDFDAWEIEIYYQDRMWEIDGLESIRVIEDGPVRAGVELRRRFGRSSVVQRMYIYDEVPRIDFETEIDWREKHRLLKVAFPVDVHSTSATYEIQFGNVQRPTHWNTSWDWGRFEVCGQRWADLSEGDYGVSLLNDCKYGHDVKDNVLRLTLLKSSTAPDPKADEGHHRFTYSLYPHAGNWRNGTVRQGYELNYPLLSAPTDGAGMLPGSLSFVSTDRDNVVVDTVKLAEDGDEVVVRAYEAYDQRGDVSLRFGAPVDRAFDCNLLEEERKPIDVADDRASLYVTPYQVRTIAVETAAFDHDRRAGGKP